ncbi:hypothetical protein LZ575_09255 [Antarcticibacterium sp. 1MA-6-2]|uniref:hypothetical protein n=1 Tax=Antarcticibacterium sp. 1MA-6-2 TaxID=2908210 RepID=UPI001F42DEA7|nr:hypothetical protein [Antarcticibacterium sp. 1MA-6-2]UJH92634.1 hypothetical protein LZ575_09255 [Antarcticibacterium sp. 1MA-6-2]
MKLLQFSLLLLFSFSFAQVEEKIQFNWDSIAQLQDIKGVNGAYTGVHNDVFIIAGGANFPGTPVWDGGNKAWYNSIAVLKKNRETFEWVKGIENQLPRPLAYGASVSTPQGVLCIGGNNEDGTYNDVFLLKWNPVSERVEIEEQAPLPVPLANMQATSIGKDIYVVGGQEESGGRASKYFFRYRNDKWEELPGLPGPGRIQLSGCKSK